MKLINSLYPLRTWPARLARLRSESALAGRHWVTAAALAFLLLYLVQAMLGLQVLGRAPLPRPASAALVAAAALRVAPAAGPDLFQPPDYLGPPPDESARLEPFYAVCPKSLSLPAPYWIALT